MTTETTSTLSHAEIKAHCELPKTEIQPLTIRLNAWRYGLRVGLPLLAVALLVAPWTAAHVYAPLWHLFSAQEVPDVALPFFWAVAANLVLLGALALMVGFGVLVLGGALVNKWLSPDWLVELATAYQQRYSQRLSMYLRNHTGGLVESQLQAMKDEAHKEALSHARYCGYYPGEDARKSAMGLTVLVTGLLLAFYYRGVTVVGNLPAGAVLAMGFVWLAAMLALIEINYDAERHSLSQLARTPLSPDVRFARYPLLFVAVIFAAAMLYLPSQKPSIHTAQAVAAHYHQQVLEQCEQETADLVVKGPADTCSVLPTVPELTAALDGTLPPERKLPLRITKTLSVLSASFEPYWEVKIEGRGHLTTPKPYRLQLSAKS